MSACACSRADGQVVRCIHCLPWNEGGSVAALGIIEGQQAERAAVVAWLRSSVWTGSAFPAETHAAVAQIADAIERGEHRRERR